MTQISEEPNAALSNRPQSEAWGTKVTGWAGVALKPKTTKARMSPTVIAVEAAWKKPVKRRLRRCAAVTRITRRKAAACSVLFGTVPAMPGKARQRYFPKKSALAAIGAANPIVAEQRPVQN